VVAARTRLRAVRAGAADRGVCAGAPARIAAGRTAAVAGAVFGVEVAAISMFIVSAKGRPN
jgi:hypothetical protein